MRTSKPTGSSYGFGPKLTKHANRSPRPNAITVSSDGSHRSSAPPSHGASRRRRRPARYRLSIDDGSALSAATVSRAQSSGCSSHGTDEPSLLKAYGRSVPAHGMGTRQPSRP